ncbi:MAG TPA: carbohydrate ABC transporter permease [Termitinemataceae bacterium]|nr:carbohydrate ABC transporter permease [Termitinemataceae bacterium]HPQ01150.1 carbohydrate ABC transporter permease [Termitinemataceae bacterium]
MKHFRSNSKKSLLSLGELIALLLVTLVFGVPLLFVFFQAGKTGPEAALQQFVPPRHPQYLTNLQEVLRTSDYMMVRAFINSTVLTVFSVLFLIVISSMAGFVMERRSHRPVVSAFHFVILSGLMVPPSVITTIWILKALHLYRTLPGLILVEIALGLPFSVLLYRAFLVTIPRELDEASFIDGCKGSTLFWKIIFPLLQPVSTTILILSGVTIFNDFVNPLYFLPGAENATIQLTLYNFISRYNTQWHLLFANVLLISIPPLVLFIFFNRRIVEGMVAGSIKG